MMITFSEVELALQRTLSLIKTSYSANDKTEEYGWYHYLDDSGAGATASAVALFTFDLCKTRFEHTNKVLRYLRSKQIKSDDPLLNGGWPIRTTTDYPIVESTAWVVLTLSECNAIFNQDGPNIEAGYRWLINNQNEDNGWGSYKGQTSRTFLTALTLMAVASIDKHSQAAIDGAKWLLDYRDSNIPAWGPIPGAEPTILHTSMALLALDRCSIKDNQSSIASSLRWLEDALDPTKMTESGTQAEDYDVPYITKGAELVFQNSLPHFCLPIGVYTILKLSNEPISSKVYEALGTILSEQQVEGNWILPRSPQRASIWAIWPFVAALTELTRVSGIKTNTELQKLNDLTIVIPSGQSLNSMSLFSSTIFASIANFARTKFGWMFLALFILGGLILVFMELIGLREYLFSLFIPAVLLVIQMVIDARR